MLDKIIFSKPLSQLFVMFRLSLDGRAESQNASPTYLHFTHYSLVVKASNGCRESGKMSVTFGTLWTQLVTYRCSVTKITNSWGMRSLLMTPCCGMKYHMDIMVFNYAYLHSPLYLYSANRSLICRIWLKPFFLLCSISGCIQKQWRETWVVQAGQAGWSQDEDPRHCGLQVWERGHSRSHHFWDAWVLHHPQQVEC